MTTRFLTAFLLASSSLLLGACSTTFDGSKVDYKTQAKQGPGLEVPPDLSQITKDNRAVVPKGGAVNASTLQGSSNASSAGSANAVAANQVGDVSVQREGTQRWLVVGRSTDKLWDEVKTFWSDHGFTLAADQPSMGLMETEWAQNRAKLPQDWFRKTFGGILGGLYDSNERDKFRTRMERTASGGTEIYITHRGMAEDFTSAQKEVLKWKARPTDPELEIEFLKRLMIRLGASHEAAQNDFPKTAGAIAQARAQIVKEGAQFSLTVNDPLDQAWRRVGMSLDRTNFTVEDRDRSKGIYFVRYVEPDAEKNAPGFFSRMFGAKAKDSLQKYQILLTAQGPSQSKVEVATDKGQVIHTPEAQSILKVLVEDLK